MGACCSSREKDIATIRTVINRPVVPKGNLLLRDFANALEKEHEAGKADAVERWFSRDFEMVGRGADKELGQVGSTKAAFLEWAHQVDDGVRKKLVAVNACRRAWGVDQPPPQKHLPMATNAQMAAPAQHAQPIQPPVYAQPAVYAPPSVVYQQPQVIYQQPQVIVQQAPTVVVHDGYGRRGFW